MAKHRKKFTQVDDGAIAVNVPQIRRGVEYSTHIAAMTRRIEHYNGRTSRVVYDRTRQGRLDRRDWNGQER